MKTTTTITTLFLVLLCSFVIIGRDGKESAQAEEHSATATDFGYTFALKNTIPLPPNGVSNPYDIFFDEGKNYIYYVSFGESPNRGLVQLDLTSNEAIPLVYAPDVGSVAMSPDKQYAYLSQSGTSSPDIFVFDMNSKQIIRTLSFDNNIDDTVATDDNRLFILTSQEIAMMDTVTGEIIESVAISGSSSGLRNLALSTDQKTLFVNGHYTVYKFDVNNDSLVELNRISDFPYNSIELSESGDFILLTQYGLSVVYRFDAEALTLLDTYVYDDYDSYNRDIRISKDGSHFYAVWGDSFQEISVATNSLTREYTNGTGFHGLAVMPINNNNVALINSDSIEILVPTSHGVALPVFTNKYCGAPSTDDFSNTNSGWPVGTFGTTTYRYIDGEYSIYQAEADRWSAVTAGHVWDSSELLEVEARIVDNRNGAYGIIYGLNDNWSDFYTFEIYPQYQVVAFFHYTSAGGWKLIQNQVVSGVNVAGINTLSISGNSSNTMRFYVNNYQVFVDYDQKIGRVGFTGASLENNVDVRYDNFVLSGENCPLPGQAFRGGGALSSTIDLERPSLNTFLSDN